MSLADALDAIPIVQNAAERAVRFPAPQIGQRVQNLATAAIERWNGSWLTDFVAVASFNEINIKLAPYAAVGDGVADDTTAIQNAITAAAGPIFLPPGTYKITSALTLKPGTILRGAGYLNTQILVSGAIRGLVYEPGVLTEGAIELRDLKIIGSSAASTLALVNFKNVTGIKVLGCDIRTTSQDALVFDTCYVIEVRSRIESFRRYGIKLLACNVWSLVPDFQANAEDCTSALLISGSGYGSVRDGNFEGASRAGNAIQLINASNVQIEQNFIELYGGAAIIGSTTASRGISIRRNALSCSQSVYVDFGGALVHESLIVEQNRSTGMGGGSTVFDPGATAEYIYRMNTKDAGAHVVGKAGQVEVYKESTNSFYSDAGRRLQNGTATGAAIDVSASNYVEVTNGGATTITAITGNGYQIVILRFMDGNSTVQNNGSIRLAGAVNYVPGANDTLTLVHIGGNVWLEIARSNN